MVKLKDLDAKLKENASEEEVKKVEQAIEFENKDKKEDQLRQMAWIAMLSMVFFTGFLFSPFVDIPRLNALGSIIQMFYVAQAGVVATFFGANAYINGGNSN